MGMEGGGGLGFKGAVLYIGLARLPVPDVSLFSDFSTILNSMVREGVGED